MSEIFFSFPFFAVYFSLFILAGNIQEEYEEAMEEYGFKIPFMAPVAFYLIEKLNIKFNSPYHRKIRTQIIELYGQRRSHTFFTVHNAQKISLVIAAVFVSGMAALMFDMDVSFYVFTIIINVLFYYWADQDLNRKTEERKRYILIDLPVFINSLAILINAGLSFYNAVQKTIRESDSGRPLYKELNFLLAEVNGGKSIFTAFEDLAKRCGLPEVTRFVSCVLQNINRGNSDLVYVLRLLSHECWQKRKDIARKQGEEASSKLVFPMVLIFVAVSIIVLAPAVVTMGGYICCQPDDMGKEVKI